MANTLLVNTAVDHSSDAGFRVWGSEFHASLVSIGLTLTSDTGQINWTTVTRPALSTSGGYEVWQFNDTLQSTTPIFIKLEYGTGPTLATYPAIWITIGQGTNGAGTLTGVFSSKSITGYPVSALSTTAPYVSRFVYNPTLGFFGFAWKLSGQYSGVYMASAFVFRSNNSVGAATSTSVQLLTNDNSVSSSGKFGVMQCLNYTTATIYPSTTAQAQNWSTHVFSQTATVVGGATIALDPVFYLTPTLGITSCLGRALISEIGINSAVSCTLVGSTAHNYVQLGYAFSGSSLAASFTGLDSSTQSTALGMMMLWE